MKKISLQIAPLLLSSLLIFSSCSKSSSSPSGGSTTADQGQFTAVATSDAQAEDVYNNVFDNVVSTNSDVGLGTGAGVFQAPEPGGEHTAGGPLGGNSCFTVTVDTTAGSSNGYPKTVTLNFGNGCTGWDNHTRMGEIITVYTGPLSQHGSIATTTFVNYYQDSINVSGTHIITNSGTSDTLGLTVQVQNGMLKFPSGNYIAWNKNRTWTQTGGQSTPYNLLSYVFSITGSSSGTAVYDDSTYQWTTNITQPLIRDLDCPFIVQGENSITWNNISATVDYGSGACDNIATVSINGGTPFEIILR
jgi:hypothetical protein